MQNLLFLEGLGFSEILIIIFIVLLFFGPDKIPEIARGLGEGVRKMKSATEDIKQEIMTQVDKNKEINDLKELKEDVDKIKDTFNDIEGTVKR